MKKIQAKPFSTDFDEQLDAAEALYGVQVQFDFSMNGLNSRQEYPKRLIKIVYKSFSRTLILTMLS